MTEQSIFLSVLNLARNNAAKDLNISNEILDIVDQLVEFAKLHQLEENEKVTDICESLVDEALKLTEQAKNMTIAISKAVDAL